MSSPAVWSPAASVSEARGRWRPERVVRTVLSSSVLGAGMSQARCRSWYRFHCVCLRGVEEEGGGGVRIETDRPIAGKVDQRARKEMGARGARLAVTPVCPISIRTVPYGQSCPPAPSRSTVRSPEPSRCLLDPKDRLGRNAGPAAPLLLHTRPPQPRPAGPAPPRRALVQGRWVATRPRPSGRLVHRSTSLNRGGSGLKQLRVGGEQREV